MDTLPSSWIVAHDNRYNIGVEDRLPDADNVQVDARKLQDYAFNVRHDIGRFKAASFAQMGYTAENWQQLARDIREQHLSQPAEPGQPSPYGQKYTITALLKGPKGRVRQVKTVWIFRPDQDFSDLVTIQLATRKRLS